MNVTQQQRDTEHQNMMESTDMLLGIEMLPGTLQDYGV